MTVTVSLVTPAFCQSVPLAQIKLGGLRYERKGKRGNL